MTKRTAEWSTRPPVTHGYEQGFLELRERLEHLWLQQVEAVTELSILLHDSRAAAGQVPTEDAAGTAGLATIEAQLEAARRELGEHDAALARFGKGTYGFCGHCGESVTATRLAAFPSARLCDSCQFWSRRT